MSGADDTYIVGPPAIAFQALMDHKERLTHSGLDLQLRKNKCYINRAYRNQEFLDAKGDIEEGYVRTSNERKTYGIDCYGVPIGSAEYVQTRLEEESLRIEKTIETTKEAMSPARIDKANIPARQCLWQLTLRSLQHLGNYWAKHIPCHLTESFCQQIDNSIDGLISKPFNLNLDTLNEKNKRKK